MMIFWLQNLSWWTEGGCVEFTLYVLLQLIERKQIAVLVSQRYVLHSNCFILINLLWHENLMNHMSNRYCLPMALFSSVIFSLFPFNSKYMLPGSCTYITNWSLELIKLNLCIRYDLGLIRVLRGTEIELDTSISISIFIWFNEYRYGYEY